MALSFPCPQCKAVVQLDKPPKDKQAKCPRCRAKFPVAVPVIPVAVAVAPVAALVPPAAVPVAAHAKPAAHAPAPAKAPVAALAKAPVVMPVKAASKQGVSKRPVPVSKPAAPPPEEPSAPSVSNELDFLKRGKAVVSAPKVTPLGFFERWWRRFIFSVKLMVVLALLGGIGTGGYYALKYFGIGSGATQTVAQAPPDDDGAGVGVPDTPAGSTVNVGTGTEDPLAFIPPGANLIVGLDGAELFGNPLLRSTADHWLVQLGLLKLLADCKENTGVELKDLLHRVTLVFKASTDLAKVESTTIILQSSVAFDQKKIDRWASTAPPRRMADKFYHDKHRDVTWAATVYMPSNRVLVLSDVPAPQWEPVFAGDGSQPALAPDALALVRTLEKNPVWGILMLDGAARAELKAGKGAAELLASIVPADVNPTLQKFLPEARAMTLRATLDANQGGLSVGIACAAEPHAVELQRVLQAAWTRLKPIKSKALHNTLVLDVEERQQIVKELVAGLQFDRQNAVVEVSFKAPVEPFRKMLKDGPLAFQAQADELFVQVAPDLGVPTPAEKPVELTAEEKTLLDAVNKLRGDGFQMPAMKPNAKLMAVARAHAANMAKQNKVDDDLDGKDTIIRVKDVAYKFGKDLLDFNLVAGEKLSVKEAADKMTKSKENLHFVKFADTGIGIARNEQTGQVYYYQVFAAPE